MLLQRRADVLASVTTKVAENIALCRQQQSLLGTWDRGAISRNLIRKLLLELGRQCGVQHRQQDRRDGLLQRLARRMEYALNIRTENPCFRLDSIDVGVKNMALARVDLDLRLHALCRVSIDQYSDGGSLTANNPAEFAGAVNEFIRNELSPPEIDTGADLNGSVLYVIERQMQRHNPRCTIIESQLHALLYPNTCAISPISVSNYFQLQQIISAISQQKLQQRSSSQSVVVGKSKAKKQAAVDLVSYWFETGQIIKQENATVSGSSSSSSQLVDEFHANNGKRDDLADAILMAVASVSWIYRARYEALKLLRS